MPTKPRPAAVTVRAPTLSRTEDGRWRVAADVDGTEAYVTADVPLVANGDAWATMMLLPAAKSRATLRVEADLDARLNANFERIQAIARRHWRFEGATIAPHRLVERAPTGGHIMFFTCGVDSFYTLRKRRDSIDRLVFVRGLNINLVDLGNEARFAPVRVGIEAVGRELGISVAFGETNLRIHPTFKRVGWNISHIAAVAGVAHTLAPVASHACIGSSERRLPLGTDPSLDPLWSSGAVEIVSDGWEAMRLDKVRAIADWPLVHRHLRVCYLNRGSELNCGVCRKCLGTLLRFEIAGARDRLQTFPQAPLVDLIDAIPWIASEQTSLWTGLTPHIGDPRIKAAVTRMLARRPSAVERLQGRALWLRETAPGRFVRRVAKRLLVE